MRGKSGSDSCKDVDVVTVLPACSTSTTADSMAALQNEQLILVLQYRTRLNVNKQPPDRKAVRRLHSTSDVIIIVLNLETIIQEYEIIRNPKVITGSEPETNKSLPNNNLEPSVRSTNNKYSAQVPSGNDQSFWFTIQPAYQPPPNYKTQGTIMMNEAPTHIIPIPALNPYQGHCAIKARLTAKGDLRHNKAREDGKGSLKLAQKNFNHLRNEWEIFLESNSTVEPCADEDGSILSQQFFRPISEIESAKNNSILDVIGIVISVNPSFPICGKKVRCSTSQSKHRLFVGNISRSWGEEDLRKVVSKVGTEVTGLELVKDVKN
ncbi:replication protein A 70 kDa DNA-binding subunit A-like [Hibiscus syriacus]|uniref:replication protein A 70 kDa DNA-binding subunit A-like n=1 Tax=Hibiscus syriacus TaxID=106335 RepID=UPI0019215635|nr:replication protein A 70 kDa DNA-binding subunit A-like [Hibiscus syriacus]